MKDKKTLFKLSLTALLLVGQVCTFAATSFTVDGMRYTTTSDSEVKVVKLSSGYYTGDIVIPSTVTYNDETYTVTSIDAAFNGSSNLTSVVIPNTVTSLGSYAFGSCSKLTSITIPNSVTSIGGYAFYQCGKLESVTLSSSLTSIGTYAFGKCTKLMSIDIPNSVTTISSHAFYGCTSLNEIVIPGSITTIQNYSFSGCTGLTSVSIPSSVTRINQGAFQNCSSLATISIPSSVTYINDDAFKSCSSLIAVHISDLAAWCGINFSSTSANPLQVAQHLYLNGEEIISLTIPSSVTSVGQYAFYGLMSLTSVTIPNTVTSIGASAFSGCSGLTAVHISDLAAWCRISFGNAYANPLNIAPHLYLNGEEITSLAIPSSITSLTTYAFTGWTGLTSVTIPSTVTKIGNNTFDGCTGLTEVIVERTTPASINAYTFRDVPATLYVPSSAVTSYQAASYWKNFSDIQPISVALNHSSIGANINDTQTLVATVTPASYASNLTWGSDNTSIATVANNGTVTAQGAGIANITASLPIGTTATCSVVVLAGTDLALDGDLTAESIGNLSEFFSNTDLTSLDLTGITSIEDGITIPANNNCIIYVPAGTILANTQNVVENDMCSNLVLVDGQKFAPSSAFTATIASYSRNMSNAWGTVCLPYAVESNDDVTYYTTGTINGDVLTLTSVDEVPAGTPAIFKANSSTLSANATNVNVVTTVQSESVTTDEITLVGSFDKTVIDDVKTDAANEYYYISGGKFMHATKKLTINPFRAYFTVPKSAAPSGGFSIAVGEDDVTAINALTGEGDTTVLGIYNIDGKPQSDLQSGLNIVKLSNGKTKKILIK
ncbi:MAG: leucine-rich repeat protein [Bacteroidaceae bacterium]|nr:leucine-rich repeat protein [Bacteroidaceae bacterium]